MGHTSGAEVPTTMWPQLRHSQTLTYVYSHGADYWDSFRNAACRKNTLPPGGCLRFIQSPGTSCWWSFRILPRPWGADRHMDVRHEPEQHQQRNRNMVHRGCNLREKAHCLRSKESCSLSVPDVTVNTHRRVYASYKPVQNGQ